MPGSLLGPGTRARAVRVVGALAGVLALTAMTMVIPLGSPPLVAHAADSSTCPHDGPCTKKQPFVDGKGKPYPAAEVTVSQTENIQQRQVIHVSWNGFQPSDNGGTDGVDNPFPEGVSNPIYYPVVLVECWGRDTAEKPMDPTRCQGPISQWPGSHRLRSSIVYAMTNDVSGTYGGVPNPRDVSWNYWGSGGPDILGFTAVDGTHYKMNPTGKGTDGVPPSLQFGSDALPANAVVSTTPASGSRKNVEFEVRGGSDLPALGCSYTQECTLEVIPIVRTSCDPKLYTGPKPDVTDRIRKIYGPQCTRDPSFGYVDSWWLGTQWKNRFSFPLRMAPRANECPVVDHRPTVTMQGSEAATALMGSWSHHFCVDPQSTFKLTHSSTPEVTARSALTNGDASGILTSLPVTGSPRPVVHAPVAVTGWTVGYKLDQQDTGYDPTRPKRLTGPYTDLTLSPLLLAKLMTESYSGGVGHEPALSGNPGSLFADPEFTALNPGFYPNLLDYQNGVIWDVNDSDAFAAMFNYIDADPVARAWLNGKPDSYSGMVVNPANRGLSAPQMSFQLRDDWTRPSDGSGPKMCQPLPWFEQITQLAPSLEIATVAVLNRKPRYQECTALHPEGKPDWGYTWAVNTRSQGIGGRNVIAFTTVPLAQRYGLSLAKLQSPVPGARAVGPTGWEGPANSYTGVDTLAAALGYMKSDKDTGVASPDWSVFPYSGAYAGVLPVYASIPTCGLDKTQASQYADVLTFAADAGQTPGTAAGKLPPGYTPLPKAYADYTRHAAQAVRDQTCAVPPPLQDPAAAVRDELGLPAPGTPGSDGSGFPSRLRTNGSPAAGNGTPGAGTTPGAAPGAGAAPSSVAARPGTIAATRGTGSWLVGWIVAILLVIGLLAALAVALVRIIAQPAHPVRKLTTNLTNQAGALFNQKTP